MTITLAVTLPEGERETRVPLAALAAVFRVPPRELETRLRTLAGSIYDRMHEGEPTEGEIDRSVPNETNTLLRSIGGTGDEGGRETPLDAATVAEALGDLAGIAAIRRLMDGTPPDLVAIALARTLAVPTAQIRRNRAAYFSTVLQGLRRAGSRSSP